MSEWITVAQGETLMDVLVNNGLASHRFEARRLVVQGAVWMHGERIKVDDLSEAVFPLYQERKAVEGVRVGSREFYLIKKVVDPARPEDEWVSVEERLPEKGQPVLVVLDLTLLRTIQVGIYLPSKGWVVGGYSKVTHWMPLPPLPEEGGDES